MSALLEAGAEVTVADIDEAGAESVLSLGATFAHTDVTSDDQVQALVDGMHERFGRLDIVVNLATVYLDRGIETTRAEWIDALNVNVVSMAMVVQAALPLLRDSSHGAVLNVSSVSSKVAQPERWTYPASKAAVVQLTRSMAMDLAPDGIRVNSLSPGWTWSRVMDQLSGGDRDRTDQVASPFHLIGRVADPAEIGSVAAFLVSDASGVQQSGVRRT